MRRGFVLLCLLGCAAAAAGTARASNDFTGHHRQVIPVVVVKGLSLADLQGLAQVGAVGLLVPNAGPRTSAGDAFAGMVRGVLYNARLPRPHDLVLIHVTKANRIPRHGPLIVVGLPPERSTKNGTRYPVAVLGPGWHGTLSSSLTRVPGLVSMADIARTALQTPHALRAKPSGDAAASVLRLESRIEVARSSALAATLVVLGLLVAFALFFPAGAPAALGAALAANLALGWAAGGSAAPRIVLLGLCTVAGGILGARYLRSRVALGFALVAVIAAYAVVMAVHPWALSLAPLGPELTSRFYGVSNLLETLLLVPALLGAKLLSERSAKLQGERFGPPFAFGAVGLPALTTIAENRLGDDGGGAIVVAASFAVLAVAISSARWRVTVPALALGVAAVVALLGADAASTTSDHLRGALDGGLRGLAHVAENRVPLSYARMLEQWYLVFPATIALAVGIAVVRSARSRREAAVPVALLAGLAVSVLVNDSPAAVSLAGLTALLAVEGGFLHRTVVLPVAARLGVYGRTTVGRPRPQE
jgi:hypothetical protein